MNNIEFKLDVSNKNLDYFEPEALKSAVEKYKQDQIDKKRSVGTMQLSNDFTVTGVVSLEHVSHIVTKLEINENKELYGELEILKTPMGKRLQSDIIDRKLTPEYSMAYRVKDNKITEIVQISVVGIKD